MSSGQLFKPWGILAVLVTCLPDSTQASTSSDIIGKAIGVSVATSLVTTLVVLAVVHFIQKMTKRKSIKRELTRESMRSAGSTRPLAPNMSHSISYDTNPLPENNNTNNGHIVRSSRIKSDFIASWCTAHKLTEHTASVLRQHGFTNQEAIDSMQPDDIPQIGLRNYAQQCILRDAINAKLKKSTSSSQSNGQYKRSNSMDEGVNQRLLDHHDASGGSSVFERSHSYDQLDGVSPPGRSLHTTQRAKSKGSRELLENGEDVDAAIIIYNRSNSRNALTKELPNIMRTISHDTKDSKSNPRNFRGLLSDEGLYDLAEMVGMEYHRLATHLKVPNSKQEQLQMDYPNSTRQRIFEMLKYWRNNCDGDKPTVKGILHKALQRCGRQDLAEDLLQEQVDGSTEQVAYHSIV